MADFPRIAREGPTRIIPFDLSEKLQVPARPRAPPLRELHPHPAGER